MLDTRSGVHQTDEALQILGEDARRGDEEGTDVYKGILRHGKSQTCQDDGDLDFEQFKSSWRPQFSH